MKLKDRTDFKLDPADKKAWLKDLRSGEFKQGNAYLHSKLNNTYCCLGVYQARTGCKDRKSIGSELLDYRVIPPEVQSKLSNMNDGFKTIKNHIVDTESKDFKQIANWISRNL